MVSFRAHLIAPVLTDELLGYVGRKHVLQQDPVEVLHRFNLFPFFLEFFFPEEIQSAVILVLRGRSGESSDRKDGG